MLAIALPLVLLPPTLAADEKRWAFDEAAKSGDAAAGQTPLLTPFYKSLLAEGSAWSEPVWTPGSNCEGTLVPREFYLLYEVTVLLLSMLFKLSALPVTENCFDQVDVVNLRLEL